MSNLSYDEVREREQGYADDQAHPVRTSISLSEFRQAMKPLCDLLGISLSASYPPMVITCDEVLFSVVASASRKDFSRERPPAVVAQWSPQSKPEDRRAELAIPCRVAICDD